MSKLRHAAIITDGNGRWATRRGLPRTEGHTKGRDNFQRICDWCLELGIPYLSFYTLSLDNLKRDKAELDHINALAHELCSEDGIRRMREKGIRVLLCGRRDLVAESDLAAYEQAERETADCSRLTVMLQVYYGGRDEIVRAARQCVADGAEISEEAISARLYAAAVDAPDPDLILRTGGYSRLSGYLPWQSIYSELYITPTLFPDLTREEFAWACRWFESIERTYGGNRAVTGGAAKTEEAAASGKE